MPSGAERGRDTIYEGVNTVRNIEIPPRSGAE